MFPFPLLRQRLQRIDINFLVKLKVFLFDCDGVLWRGSQEIPRAMETINYLKDNGKIIYYCTNSSSRSRQATVEKLKSYGVDASIDQVITSSYATALYLQKKPDHGEVYIVGEKGIYDELEAVGIKCHGMEDNGATDITLLKNMNPAIGTVVVGLDKNVNYIKLSRAAAYIRDHNLNDSYPSSNSI